MLEKLFKNIADPKTRKYIYTVLIALVPLLVGYGYVEESLVPTLLGVISAVLGQAMAAGNTKSSVDTPHSE